MIIVASSTMIAAVSGSDFYKVYMVDGGEFEVVKGADGDDDDDNDDDGGEVARQRSYPEVQLHRSANPQSRGRLPGQTPSQAKQAFFVLFVYPYATSHGNTSYLTNHPQPARVHSPSPHQRKEYHRLRFIKNSKKKKSSENGSPPPQERYLTYSFCFARSNTLNTQFTNPTIIALAVGGYKDTYEIASTSGTPCWDYKEPESCST